MVFLDPASLILSQALKSEVNLQLIAEVKPSCTVTVDETTYSGLIQYQDRCHFDGTWDLLGKSCYASTGSKGIIKHVQNKIFTCN